MLTPSTLRFRALRYHLPLAAVLALSLVLCPAASALCPHPAEAHGETGHPAEVPVDVPAEAPCHDAPAPRPMPDAPAPDDGPGGTVCEAPCCAAAASPAPVEAPASAPAPLAVEVAEAWAPVAGRALERAPVGAPPPLERYLETGRLRL